MLKISGYTSEQIETNRTVNQSASTVLNRAIEIKVSTEEQKAGVMEIVKSVSSMNAVSQQSAIEAESLSSNAERLAEMAKDLKKEIDYFRS
jgi:methyl-accepting chemotaxis protein